MRSTKKAREQLSESFLKAISEKPLKWKSGFISMVPLNGIYGTKYRNINRLILQNVMSKRGYNDPRFYTQSYIFGSEENRSKDWSDPTKIKVIKGEKPVIIESKFYVPKENEGNLNPISPKEYWKLELSEQEKYRLVRKNVFVYNANQLTGVGVFKMNALELTDKQLKGYVDQAIKNMEVKSYEGLDVTTPCYVPSMDLIKMPKAMQFNNEYEYYSTKLHEICHATGHESRLDRNLKSDDIESYAIEELRAEIASCFIASDLHMEIDSEIHNKNHMAYVQSWSKTIKADEKILTSAILEAESIADYVMEAAEFEREKANDISFKKESVNKNISKDNIKSAEFENEKML